MNLFVRLVGLFFAVHVTAYADTIITVNPSWAELNYQQVNVLDDSDPYNVFDSYARGLGVDLRFALTEQWALVANAASLQECNHEDFVTCDFYREGNASESQGWYKQQSLGLSWSQALARRYVAELTYRYQHEAFRLHDDFCFLWVCDLTQTDNPDYVRYRDHDNHLVALTGRAQWGRFELALSAMHSFGDLNESQWRLENRFLVTRYLNLIFALQDSDERFQLSFGVRGRW